MFDIKKSVIACYDRLVDREPEGYSQWLNPISDIEGSVKIGVAGISAGVAKEKSLISRSDFSAEAAGLACIGWIHIDNRTSFLQSLVFDKALQLPESPRMQLPVKSFAFILSDVSYPFHRYNVTAPQTAYNFFAYSMVFASHKPFPFAREFFQMYLSRLRAFALQSGNIYLMLLHLRNYASVELAVRSYGEVLYSDINTENTPMLSRAYYWLDVFGKAQPEEHPVFLVHPKNAFIDFPADIFFCIFGNRDIEFLASFDCGQANNSVLERETSWGVVSHGIFANYRFALGTLNHPASLLNTSNGKLGLKSIYSQFLVSEWVQFDIIPYSFRPRSINTELQTPAIYFYSFRNSIIIWNFDVDRHSAQHNISIGENALKPRGVRSSDRTFQFSPLTNYVDILEAI